jgi:hypothetical protein
MNLFGSTDGASGIAIADALRVSGLYGHSDSHWPVRLLEEVDDIELVLVVLFVGAVKQVWASESFCSPATNRSRSSAGAPAASRR